MYQRSSNICSWAEHNDLEIQGKAPVRLINRITRADHLWSEKQGTRLCRHSTSLGKGQSGPAPAQEELQKGLCLKKMLQHTRGCHVQHAPFLAASKAPVSRVKRSEHFAYSLSPLGGLFPLGRQQEGRFLMVRRAQELQTVPGLCCEWWGSSQKMA